MLALLAHCGWPRDNPYDPRRCTTRCAAGEICFEGKCSGPGKDTRLPSEDLPRPADGRHDPLPSFDKSVSLDRSLTHPDGPSADRPRADKRKPDITSQVKDSSPPSACTAWSSWACDETISGFECQATCSSSGILFTVLCMSSGCYCQRDQPLTSHGCGSGVVGTKCGRCSDAFNSKCCDILFY